MSKGNRSCKDSPQNLTPILSTRSLASDNPSSGNKAIAVSGPSGSGKTELICRLLDWFGPQGLTVAVLKHSHHPEVGDDGKDTWRYRQAGARLVALAAPGLVQVTRRFPVEPPLEDVLAALAPEADLILVEGYKSSLIPKLALVDRRGGQQLPDYPRIIALVSPVPLATSLPVFQPHQVGAIGRFILDFLRPGPGREGKG